MAARLWLESLRRLRARQVFARLARRARYRVLYPWLGPALFPTPGPLPAGPDLDAPFAEGPAARHRPADGAVDEIVERRFRFLNRPPVDLARPADWRKMPDGDRLWSYRLHYGEWALPLADAVLAASDEPAAARFEAALIELLRDWIAHNPPGRPPAWDPYPTARRLVAWARLPFALRKSASFNEFWRRSLEPSLRRQARFLAANLEHDLPNNHLLADYRALAWVGLLFDRWPESDRWRRLGLGGLWREIRRQVLPDGVHCERSVTYHVAVLQDLLETWRLTRRCGPEVPVDVEPTLRAMLRFLAETRAPDGTWPMVNDSVAGDPIDPRDVLLAGGALFDEPAFLAAGRGGDGAYAAWLAGSPPRTADPPALMPSIAFPAAGYAVLRDGAGGYLLFDAGPMGPPEVPGHGHADALSIVLHGGGRPLVVDPGVETYAAGPSRDRCRSLAVHNSVTVDGADPCVFWGPFRVAWPPKARLLEASSEHVLGEHLGYRGRGVVHRRRVTCRGQGVWEIDDRFEGSGEHRFAFNLQLAPGAVLETDGAVGRVTWPDGIRLEIRPLEAAEGAVTEAAAGWVAPGWNLREEAPRYLLQWTSAVPCGLRVLLSVETASGRLSFAI